MNLCLDIGNTHLFGGLYQQDKMVFTFRYPTQHAGTSDQIGIFLTQILHEHQQDPSHVTQITLCSVVPQLEYSMQAACRKYLPNATTLFLKAGIKTGLHIQYKHTQELGADRVANAVGAIAHHPKANIIIVDLGTTTHFSSIKAGKYFLGGAIAPGLKMAMHAMQNGTAQLPATEITNQIHVLGQTTKENMQSGIYHGYVGLITHMLTQLKQHSFNNIPCLCIATGGFSHLFKGAIPFDYYYPHLILHGLHQIARMNQTTTT